MKVATVLLEEGKMICMTEANVVCYPDQYAKGYLGGNLAYDLDDEFADKYIMLHIHSLPLHLDNKNC
jgi:hypothetical protein